MTIRRNSRVTVPLISDAVAEPVERGIRVPEIASSDQVRSGQGRLGQGSSGLVWSSLIRSGLIWSGMVRYNWVG